MTKNSFLRLVLRLGLRLVRRFAPGSLGLVLLSGSCCIMTFRFLRPNGHLIVVEPMLLTTADELEPRVLALGSVWKDIVVRKDQEELSKLPRELVGGCPVSDLEKMTQ